MVLTHYNNSGRTENTKLQFHKKNLLFYLDREFYLPQVNDSMRVLQMGSGKRKRLAERRNRKPEIQKNDELNVSYFNNDYRSMEKESWILSRILEKDVPQDKEDANSKISNLIKGRYYDNFKPDNSDDEAQLLAYEAYSYTGNKRRETALRALDISENCADAYVIIAEMERDLLKRKILFEKGVKAGRNYLGENIFKEYKGKFWGLTRTRPFMRAMDGLAATLWSLGEYEQAGSVYEEILDLNPMDNQGVRYNLLIIYIETRSLNKAEDLIRKYEDDYRADLLYNKALLLFIKTGINVETKRVIRDAFKLNHFIPPMLLGRIRLPELQMYISPGSKEEAANYTVTSIAAWHKVPNAIQWLQKEYDLYSGSLS